MTDEADSSVVLAELQVALFRECNGASANGIQREIKVKGQVLGTVTVTVVLAELQVALFRECNGASANGIQREIKVKGQVLGTVTSFKYLGAVVSDDGSKPEVLSRIAQATAALTKLKPIWRDNNITLGSKLKLMRSLVISIFLYACESCTLTAELEKRTQVFEMSCHRRLLNSSYKDHVTNEEVRRKIQAAIGEYDELLTLVKKRKLRWFGHVSKSSGLAKTILQGTVKGTGKRGRQKKRWERWAKSGQEWTLPSQLGQLKTGQNGKGLLRIHLWCPDDLPRLWDRIENIIELSFCFSDVTLLTCT